MKPHANKARFALHSGVSLAALLLGAAQGSAQSSSIAEVDSEQEQAQSQGGISTIVVTATKRSEDLQKVPIAISAIGGEELIQRGITDTSDLMGALPNLQVTSAYSETQPNFSLRGVGVANEFSAATASPVGVYVDEVYQSFRASHGQQLYDLERVEVLRGPQGTLFGRNTTGGAINFITRKPELEGTNGYLTLSYGNFNRIFAEGAIETTIVDDVFGVRVAGTYVDADGYTFNPTLGQDFAEVNNVSGRVTFQFEPSPDFTMSLKLYGARSNPLQDLPYGIGYLEGRTDAAGYSRFAPRPELGGRILEQDEVQADTAGRYFTDSYGASLTVEGKLSDDLTLTAIMGYDEATFRLSPFDCDGSPNDVCAIRYFSASENLNFDTRLSFDNGGPFRFIVGGYFGEDQIDTINEPDFFGFLRPLLQSFGVPGEFNNIPIAVGNSLRTLPAFALDPTIPISDPGFCAPVVVNPAGFFDARSLIAFNADVAATNSAGGTAVQGACAAAGAPPFGPILARQEFTITRPSIAVYGEAEVDLTDRLTLTMGLRYTFDDVRLSNASSVLFDLAGENAFASTVPYEFPLTGTPGRVQASEDTGELTGRVILDYQASEDVLLYASYSRGYRAGTFNALAYQDISQVYFVDPEQVDAYEIGLKSQFANNTVQLNLAGFYYDYTGQQIAQIIGATSFLRSADGRLFGAEAELTWQPADFIRLDAAMGYLNSEYRGNEVDPTDPTALTLNINGNDFPNAPELTFNAGIELIPYDDGRNKLTLRGNASYMGEYFFDPFGNYGQDPCDQPAPGSNVLLATPELACGNPAYWLFDARVTYERDDFALSLWGRNLTDEFYYVYGLNLNAFFQDYLTRGAPRTYGVEASIRF
ncbi:MAG: TonB-dependent receptor [Erythrobacter sp.]|jgi:iron complex outermembrane receptor protein|nr:TonB-dependent receptor [Erythrobacter sp.]